MEWIYIVGLSLNGLGYMQFISMQSVLDNTPTHNAVKNISAVAGLVALAMGFVLFQWWVPLVGLLPAVTIARLVLSGTALERMPHIMIGTGLVLLFISLMGA